MADLAFPTVKVSDLPTATTVVGGDFAVLDQSDTTRKASMDTIVSQMRITKIVFFSEGGFLESKKDLAYFATDNKYYTWNGAYPKTVPVGSTPATAGGVSATTWQEFGAAGGSSGGRIVDLGSLTTAATCNLTLGEAFVGVLNGGQCVIAFTNPSVTPDTTQVFSVSLKQGTGANLVSWPSNVKWSYGRVPVLSYKTGVRDIFQFITYDNGTSWIGSLTLAGVE